MECDLPYGCPGEFHRNLSHNRAFLISSLCPAVEAAVVGDFEGGLVKFSTRTLKALTVVALTWGLIAVTTPGAYAAEPSACQRSPRYAVAQLCADQRQNTYGFFVTFAYPTATYAAPSSGWEDFTNETQFFTDEAMTKSFALGLSMQYRGTQTNYQPYWVDNTNAFTPHTIGSPATASDLKVHTFMAMPHCDSCNTWDLFYDFVFVGTTGAQPNSFSHHLMTGWTLADMYGPVALSATQNRVMFLNGNLQFVRYDKTVTSTRAPDGNCAPGANPDYCWHFDTNVATTTSGSVQYVTSWDVTKRIVKPGAASTSPSPFTAARSAVDDDLVRRAQDIADGYRARR
jgi:hypothetical protein